MNANGLTRRTGKRCVVAMVLGTALSTITVAPSTAAAKSGQATERAVCEISRYCTACWRNARLHPDCWQDCTQEVFCRLLERVGSESLGTVLNDVSEERREFIRAIDTVKKRTQRARKYAPLPDQVSGRQGEKGMAKEEREAVRTAATEVLSGRQRRILQLSLAGWSVADISRQLSLPAARVSDEKYKAIQKLRERLVEEI
jgi:RNA polymerase sigma factor (sigma-70 family)